MANIGYSAICDGILLVGQDDLDANRSSAAFLGLDEGLEQLLLAMQKNVINQVPLLEHRLLHATDDMSQTVSAMSSLLYPISAFGVNLV